MVRELDGNCTLVVRQLLYNIQEYSVDLNEYGDKLQL